MFWICFEQTAWQRALSQSNRESTLHHVELVDKVEHVVRYGLITLTFLGLIVDIFCFKWLRAAHALLYIELCYAFMNAMVPFESGKGVGQTLMLLSLLSSLCFSCDPLPNFIFLTVFLLQLAFLQVPAVWNIHIDEIYVFENTLLILGILSIFLLACMLVTELAKAR